MKYIDQIEKVQLTPRQMIKAKELNIDNLNAIVMREENSMLQIRKEWEVINKRLKDARKNISNVLNEVRELK